MTQQGTEHYCDDGDLYERCLSRSKLSAQNSTQSNHQNPTADCAVLAALQ